MSAWSHLGLPRVALFLFFTALGGAPRIDLLRRTDYNAGKEMVVRFISDNHNTAERMSATRDDADNKGSKHAPFFTACLSKVRELSKVRVLVLPGRYRKQLCITEFFNISIIRAFNVSTTHVISIPVHDKLTQSSLRS